MKSQFMIKAGQFFFRYRSLLFPAIFISMLFIFRPHVMVNEHVTGLIVATGFALAFLGELFRVITIGFDYIDRGGKDKQPHASRLVTRGMYNHVRNPMYVGNLMIAVGIGLYSGAPFVLVTVLPFFIFAYYAIMAAEESFLRQNFGTEYEDYCARVNRLCPRFKGIRESFKGFSFNWKRVVEKDNGTAFYTFLALTLIPWWRLGLLEGREAAAPYIPLQLIVAALLTAGYVLAQYLKKTGRLSPAQ